MKRTAVRIVTTDREIDDAIVCANDYEHHRPKAVEVNYRSKDDAFEIKLASGVKLTIPRMLLQGLESATPAQLRDISIVDAQSGLHWEKLDVDHYIPNLIDGILGTRAWMSDLGKIGGSARSDAKARAARKNGSKGGRPRKSASLA